MLNWSSSKSCQKNPSKKSLVPKWAQTNYMNGFTVKGALIIHPSIIFDPDLFYSALDSFNSCSTALMVLTRELWWLLLKKHLLFITNSFSIHFSFPLLFIFQYWHWIIFLIILKISFNLTLTPDLKSNFLVYLNHYSIYFLKLILKYW